MTEEELKAIGYYIIRADDGDRYYWEVYASDELIHIAVSQKEAEKYLTKLTDFIQNKN